MSRGVLPWLAISSAALLLYAGARRSEQRASAGGTPGSSTPEPRALVRLRAAELRNARLVYRPIGQTGEAYPRWVRALDGKSGVYVIKEVQRDGSARTVYVGESHTGRLYQTLTRHFQTWRRSKRFWSGQYGGQGHDPGVTYPRHKVLVAARALSAERAIEEEARLIDELRPRDNLIGQPEEVIPF